ncbi:hypothetical protein FisN_16Lh077 [Fistulifera solaris]|uniref:Uncharacterized protein n=1 Tax=Fistulifera solaris TaxID=1519565 RepID=A0A1Z5KIZ9_FISSO|nr:hypothetical protein FisN_16Lh077 [Fistulifera solaris]|eukprot:GAX26249.1 hypothetical protein FisN_16Lh077 [Fistulifera solaris]
MSAVDSSSSVDSRFDVESKPKGNYTRDTAGDEVDSGSSSSDSNDYDSDNSDSCKSDDDNSRGAEDTSLIKGKKANHLPLMKVPLARPSPPTLGGQHPKMRIKLKLPTKANAPSRREATSESDDEDVKATVVESDDEEAVTAVIALDESTTQKPMSFKPVSVPAKRRSIHPTKPIKMPPLQSPGLLMIPPNHVNGVKGTGMYSIIPSLNKDGFTTPASVFEETMKLAGYTYEGRSQVPHRGSSVERVVDDMFDSNVHLALHIPPFVPPGLFTPKNEHSVVASDKAKQESNQLVQSMIDALKPVANRQQSVDEKSSRKRKRPLSFRDMMPISLTINYPRDYVEKRKTYIQQVHERERAIVALQEAEELDELPSNQEMSAKQKITIPPIPIPPSPPHLSECTMDDNDYQNLLNEDAHPLYIPKGRERCVAHLDEKCFHITNGRYFGLASNLIADPNFVGPNAPGIAGVSASAGAGLATSTSGTTATTLTASSFQNMSSTDEKVEVRRKSLDISTKKNGPQNLSDGSTGARVVSGSKSISSENEVKKGKEAGEGITDSIRTEIIKAAVHAARTNQHGQSFHAPNGQRFPDVSKAFALYAGIKPCERCKSNKQGVRSSLVYSQQSLFAYLYS